MTPHIFASELTLLSRLEIITNRFPDQLAISYLPEGDPTGAENRTYKQLKQNADSVASVIRMQASQGDRVLLLLPPGPDYFAAVWGCLLAGVVVVPVQIPLQAAQFDFINNIIEDCNPRLLITEDLVYPLIGEAVRSVKDSCDWLTLQQALNHINPGKIRSPESHQTALLQYTSGSTGTPKGVVSTYNNLDASIDLMLEVAAIDEKSTVVSWLPLFHNMGFLSFGLLPLSVGAHLVLIPTDKFMANPARWFIAMSHYRATHSGAPNIGYETCLNFLPDALLDRLDLSTWKVAAIGSEPLKSNLIDQFTERFFTSGFQPETFLTTYGFSEATVFCSGADHHSKVPRLDVDKTSFEAGEISAPRSQHTKTLISVGKARSNVAIVNPDTKQMCSERELGEIWICGPTVAAGYWNKPIVTAETFGQYTLDGSGPYVRSGDIGMVADGNLYVVGRRKELIIIGSKKLHPLDVEQAINSAHQSFVPYATIAGSWEADNREALIIFQEIKPDTAPALFDKIVNIIGDVVYERFGVNVERIVLLGVGSLPRTHNGKLQRIKCCERVDSGSLNDSLKLDWSIQKECPEVRQLPEPMAELQSMPLTLTEGKLITIWLEMLNRSSISIHDDFISLGGQSIIATRMVSRVREEFGKEVTVRDLFKHSSIKNIASYIDNECDELVSSSNWKHTELPYDEDGRLPLTSAQKRMWLLNLLEPNSSNYHMSVSYNITAGLCVGTLQKALNALIERHKILRTVYTKSEEGEPKQHILSDQQLLIELNDLSNLHHTDLQTALGASISTSQMRPFDLSNDMMLRACLNRVEDDHYYLTLTIHHIAADGWSVEILANELSSLYNSFLVNLTPSLKPVPWQYAEWALKQELSTPEHYGASTQYWIQHLKNLPDRHSLPLDHPYNGQFDAGKLEVHIDAKQLEKLIKAGQKIGATLYMQLQLAMAVVMARLSGDFDSTDELTKDIVIGAAYANRDHADCSTIVGFMVNSLVIRHQLEQGVSLLQLMEQCRATVLEAFEHADTPFELLVEKLNPRRSENYNPLFQVMINLQHKENWQLELTGATVDPSQTYNQEAKFDLALDCTSGDDGLELKWEFNKKILNSTTVGRWAGYFNKILDALIEKPNCQWDQISLLDEAEKTHLLYGLNDTYRPLPDLCVHQLFERYVEQSPNAVALKYSNEEITYRDLNSQAEKVAAHLSNYNIQPEDRIAVLMERSQWSVIAMLAILKAGAGYVPIDPAYPRKRIDFILEDATPSVILFNGDIDSILLNQVSSSAQQIPNLDIQEAARMTKLVSSGTTKPVVKPKPQNLAYMMYTSGTTGRPKGVVIEHRQIINLVFNNLHAPLDQKDCMAHCGNPAFDAATWEVWGALCRGASVAIIAPETVLQPDNLTRELLSKQVTSMMITVSLFNQYRHNLASILRHLRYCLIGGEAVDATAILETLENSAPQTFINDYGPTEATVFATCHVIRGRDKNKNTIPIGTPVTNTQIYILDRNKQPVPSGVVGEMYIGGAQVARGYWNRIDLNAERFTDNPFCLPREKSISSRMYRTGDLARWNTDDEVEFIGRNDSQIKIRGYRVELREVESAFKSIELIKESVVRATVDDKGDTRLVAYIVSTPNLNLDDHILIERTRQTLRSELPEHMIPACWVRLDSLPLTPHGKLDVKSLSNAVTAPFNEIQSEPPQTDIEKIIAQAWTELLGTDKINRFDNFFNLGGHSLIAVKLAASLRKQGILIDIRSIFRATDLRDMATRIRLITSNDAPLIIESANVPIYVIKPTLSDFPHLDITPEEFNSLLEQVRSEPGNIQAIYPLSTLQGGILFHHVVSQQDDPYLLRSLIQIDRKTSLDVFLSALKLVVERHDVLRTSIHWRDLSQPVQVVHRVAELNCKSLDVNENHGLSELSAIQSIIDHLKQASDYFDISNSPLIQVAICPSGNSYYLGIQAHHIIADHQSMEQIFSEISLIVNGQQKVLGETIPYSHYVLQQRKRDLVESEAYFRRKLSGFNSPSFMFGETRHSLGRDQLATNTAYLEPLTLVRLKNAARQHNVTLSTIAHLAWGLVISACSGMSDVVFGTVVSGRVTGEPEPNSMVGLFINTLPIRLKKQTKNRINLSEFLTQLHTQLGELTLHEQTPLSVIKRSSCVPSDQPLFNTILNFRHKQDDLADDVLFELKEKGIVPLTMEQNSHYPVALSITETSTDLHLTLQTTGSLDSSLILEYYLTALGNIVDSLSVSDESTLDEISVLPERVTTHLIDNLAKSETCKLKDIPVHIRFQKWASKTPNTIAVKSGEEQITYEELNHRSNQVAHSLIDYAIAPDQRVAVYFERGINMIVGMLGILKAGAGYLPLDKNLPDSRIQFMLGDSNPTLLITDSSNQEEITKKAKPADIRIFNLDDFNHKKQQNPSLNNLNVEKLAYTIYTSGSTGDPKGVDIENQQLSNLIDSMNAQFTYEKDDRWTLFHSISFDFSVWEIWGALTSGATLVVVDEQTSKSSEDFLKLLQDQEISVLNQTPGAFKSLLTAMDGADQKYRLPALKQVILSGEALDTSVQLEWNRLNPSNSAKLINMYGITEITVVGTFHDVTFEGEKPVIGRPIPNTEIYILDDQKSLLPPGVPGEIYVGGSQISRGYWNRPELNVSRYIKTVFRKGEEYTPIKLYKSGDLGRWNDNGILEYLGRNDSQVKIRGYRIELGEIENTLRQHDCVIDAKLVIRETGITRSLIAYIVPGKNKEVIPKSLDDYLKTTLPNYMIPSQYVVIDQLPLTSNGKIDSSKLPPPFDTELPEYYQPPTGAIEEKLAEIWVDLLGVQYPCRTKSFMEQGGDSLLAVQIHNAIKKSFNVELPLRTVFELASIEKIGQLIQFLLISADQEDQERDLEEGELA